MLVSPEPETAPQESTCSNLTVWVSLCTLWCRAGLYATTLCPTVPPPPPKCDLSGGCDLADLFVCIISGPNPAGAGYKQVANGGRDETAAGR